LKRTILESVSLNLESVCITSENACVNRKTVCSPCKNACVNLKSLFASFSLLFFIAGGLNPRQGKERKERTATRPRQGLYISYPVGLRPPPLRLRRGIFLDAQFPSFQRGVSRASRDGVF
jgi:hypothetical protein